MTFDFSALPVGHVRSAVHAPDPVLSQPGIEVDPADPSVLTLAADLIATMRSHVGCVGIAAHQVGVPWRMFAVDVTGHPKAKTCHGLFVLCNAHVVESSRRERGREGCLSVPDFTGDVRRARRLVVAGQLPLTGELVTITTDAFEAVCVQHEMDHIEGVLFLDRVTGAHALHARQTYR
ncbi:MAG: peptide deformylase [Actinomycetota bacterium]